MPNEDLISSGQESALEHQVLALPLYFCDPVIIGRHPDEVGDARAMLLTASGTYLDLNDRKMLVTSAHVVRKYEELLREDERTIFQVPGIGLIDVGQQLIDIDDKSDLASIDLRGWELTNRQDVRDEFVPRQYYKPSNWPPEPVNEGDVVAYAGWPGALRTESNGARNIEHNPYSIIAVKVSLATPDHFNVKLDRSDLKLAFGRTTLDAKDYDFGGMSGAPVLRKGPLAYELVGIVAEYQELADTFVVTAAANIKSTGQLWHNTRR
jgi:hypothetical protein